MHATRRQFIAASGAMLAAQGNLPAAETASDDAAPRLQAALDQGGMLELAPGTYRLNAPLQIDTTRTGYTGIRGPQGAARLIMCAPGPAIRIVGDHQGTAQPDSVQDHTWERERFPLLCGFEIVGEHPEADGIELEKTMQAVIERVLIRRCRHAIHLVNRNRNVIIAQCQIYDNLDTGIFFDNVNLHQVNIFGNHISYCRRAGIRQLNGDVHNIQITGNDIEYNAGCEDGLSGEIVLETPENGVISEYTIASNTLQAVPDNPGANIYLQHGPHDSGGSGLIAITGNVLGSRDLNIAARNIPDGITVSGNTIYTGVSDNLVLENCANVVVSGNLIRHSGEYAEKFQDRGGIRLLDCADSALNGNIIRARDCGTPENGATVALTRCQGIAIVNNQILDVYRRGIALEECTGCRVSGNSVQPRKDMQPPPQTVCSLGTAQNNVIEGNLP